MASEESSEGRANIAADFEVLTEGDIPGASLDGKKPKQLNITQLRRWLACRGAPLSGKKPQLIERAECYIQYGWDKYIVDPDKGMNCRRKLSAIHQPDSEPHHLLQSLPLPSDPQWTKQLQCLPTITFNTIYNFLVDRKVLLKKVSHIENVMESQEQLSSEEGSCDKSWYESVEYTRTLEKAYRFFKDGHVQAIKYHPWSSQPDVICVTSTVLPSMRKDRVYCATIAIKEPTCRVVTAYCTCPAGLSGCCNHITSTLYCLEDFVRRGLREEERMGCTEKLQKWNQPRKRNVEPRPTDDVVLTKAEYGKEKRSKALHVNKWDCRPDTRRIVDPNKARRLRESLSEIEQNKLYSADFAICTATTVKERKQALEKKSMISSYGTSCFLQILDEEPAPEISRKEEMRKERLARAEEQKQLFMQQLAVQQTSVQHDHDYVLSCDAAPSKQCITCETVIQKRADELYNQHVCVSPNSISEVEESTRGQHQSQKWHHERRLRLTASVMKEICHRRPSTSCTGFIKKKLSSKSIDTPAISYGRKNESQAVSSYVNYQKSKGKFVQIESCGLYVDKAFPWLAASPDAIVTDFSKASHSKGCLEIKCPYMCERRTVTDACKNINGFYLVDVDGSTELSKSHMYFYQVQTQMHVTCLNWCDFCVWSPVGEPFVQRIEYDKAFMDKALTKAQNFHFNKFLPAVTPYMIISPCGYSNLSQNSPTKEIPLHRQVLPKLEPSTKCNTDPYLNLGMHRTSVSHIKQDSKKQEFNTEKLVPARNCDQILGESVYQKIIQPSECDDLQLVAAYSKPSPEFQSMKSILLHLKLRKHAVRGDGNCLYHAVAHQAGLIPSSSSGDEAVCRNLRHLTFLTMLNYPTIQSEGSLSQVDWMDKQQAVLRDNEWGGDLEIRLMAIGLKKEVIVVTDSTVGNVFARKYPYQPPPVSKMKGGVFIPLTCDELCAQYDSLPCHNSLVLLYNGHNHFDSTRPL